MAELASTELEPADDIGGKDLAHDGTSAGPWGVMEYFVIVQFLSPAILMLPGMQVLRMPIRVLPYAISLALFCFLFQQRSLVGRDSIRVPGSGWLILVLFLLCAGLFHPDTILKSGVAQLGFQLTILCPIFWTMYARVTVRQVHRIMWLCLACNALGALMGALQVLWPEHFLPVEFSRNLAYDYLGSLSYEGADGREIVRPPGLSDVPGGAARGAVTASFFALFFATERHTSRVVKLALVSVLLVSFFTLYLTQVRSSFLVLLGSAAVLAFMRMRRGEGGWSVGVVLLVVGGVALSFSLAVQVGGEQVSERYMDLAESGLLESYRQNRGHFLNYTLNYVLWEYPMGAGLGRWGMMNSYFGENLLVPSLWAEIQLTGWLYDGGIPMVFFYGSALSVCFGTMYKLTLWTRSPALAKMAEGIFCLNLITVVTSFSGPSFNEQSGMMFWFLYGLLVSATNTTCSKEDLV